MYLLIYGDVKVQNHVKYTEIFSSPYRSPISSYLTICSKSDIPNTQSY